MQLNQARPYNSCVFNPERRNPLVQALFGGKKGPGSPGEGGASQTQTISESEEDGGGGLDALCQLGLVAALGLLRLLLNLASGSQAKLPWGLLRRFSSRRGKRTLSDFEAALFSLAPNARCWAPPLSLSLAAIPQEKSPQRPGGKC